MFTLDEFFWLDDTNDLMTHNLIKNFSSRQKLQYYGISIILHFILKIMFTLNESFQLDSINNFNKKNWR